MYIGLISDTHDNIYNIEKFVKICRDKNKEKIAKYMKIYRNNNKEKTAKYNKKHAINNRKKLNNSYLKNLIMNKNNLKAKDIPQELIEIKRLHIKLIRKIKEIKHVNNQC
jgi:hypothetical protein